MKKLFLISLISGVISSGLTACSSAAPQAKAVEANDAKILLDKSRQGSELSQAQTLMMSGKYDEAIKAFADFQNKNPHSVFFQSAALGIAQSIELKGKWNESIVEYKKVVEATQQVQPILAAYALYRMSFCYEAMGQDEKVIATLLDARQRGEKLDPKITLAAIPARLSAAYNRMQQPADSLIELSKAQKGVEQLIKLHQAEADKSWLGETYLEMGKLSTNQLSLDSLSSVASTLRSVQVFTIKAMELNLPPFSQQASQALIENYRDMWNLTMQVPLDSSLDEASAAKVQAVAQIQVVVEILKLMIDLQQHRSAEEFTGNSYLTAFYSYIDEVEKRGQLLLANKAEFNKVTLESIANQNLKREGVAYSDTLLPEEKEFVESSKATKPQKKQQNKSDPNL